MEKAIFYVRAMRGEGTGESYEDIIARYQAKMQEKGICEIVDSYADGSPLDDLIESNSLIEIKGMCQEQECKYLVIPTADELGSSLSAKADAVRELRKIGVSVYIADADINTSKLTAEQMQMVFAEVFNTVIELDRKMKTVISSMIETEHKTVSKWTVYACGKQKQEKRRRICICGLDFGHRLRNAIKRLLRCNNSLKVMAMYMISIEGMW